jgi:ribose transport system ATP-binding protein
VEPGLSLPAPTAAETDEAARGSSARRLEVVDVSKTFGRYRALRGVHLDVVPGEIHGLIGQNGSGKSTLAKILTGYHAPDPGGRVLVDGTPVRLPVRPREAQAQGLAVVHQSLGLVDDLSVVENLRVGRFRANRLTRSIRWREERTEAAAVLDRLGHRIALGARVGDLSEEDRATVAIARALQDAEPGRGVIVFDESTRSLRRASLEHFYATLDEVVATGTSVLLISHHMEEVLEATDRVTVLRDGAVVAAGLRTADLAENDLVRAVMGRSLESMTTRADAGPPAGDAEAVAVRGIAGRQVSDLDLQLRPGEVVGVTGLADSGHDELPYLLGGAVRARAGTLRLGADSHDLTGWDTRAAMAAGVVLVPEGREHAGLALDLTVADNVLLPRPPSRAGVLPVDRRAESAVVADWVRRLDVRPPHPAAPVGTLSGGNQQKVLLAKWLAIGPRLLLLHEPTQAVDVGARQTITAAVRRAAAAGCAVLIAGTDETELTMMCDRVLVLRSGRAVQELIGDFTPDDIVASIFSGHIRKSLRTARER